NQRQVQVANKYLATLIASCVLIQRVGVCAVPIRIKSSSPFIIVHLAKRSWNYGSWACVFKVTTNIECLCIFVRY
ncbi:hypothetical protein BGY98DRAFT_976441, partial [Russula aff. rugulosa BPL654]